MPLSRSRASTVYPHVCGGTAVTESSPKLVNGLSPRVRGNHRIAPFQDAFHRSIPACAGEPRQPTTVPTLGSIPACAGEPQMPE